ncbi:MAG: ammonia-forming cytochrome c nitrite reductase subunit c552 [Deltaproteobacteria bacterium]|jgi:nitrite reductase (cytochrome c-552)|nr:ammonia-forming cytochrome c nitrite reductase subunit c552 [Deltaproteobacteria bacterium]
MANDRSSVSVWLVGIFIFCGAAAGMLILGLASYLAVEKRAETATVFNNRKVEITGIEPQNAIWGTNYPREYRTWAKSADMSPQSLYMGGAPLDRLRSRPFMAVFWAGSTYAMDYQAPRGHFFSVEDIRKTLRTGNPGVDGGQDIETASCWTCKSTDVPRIIKELGADGFYGSPWSGMGDQVVNPVGCAVCHDPATMELAISLPPLKEAFQRAGKDVTRASLQEKRGLVCAQCHVEFFLQEDGSRVTLPWDGGNWGNGPAELKEVTAEQIEKYYDDMGHYDFINPVSGTPVLKAHHPDWELFSLGDHGRNGLTCADCHMPYVSEGGIKYSNHQLRSPLSDISTTCGTCHRDSAGELGSRVFERVKKVEELSERLEAALLRAHVMARAAMDAGADDGQLAEARKLIRAAQWRWDYIESSHGGGFHAPLECLRLLGLGIDQALRAQLALQAVLIGLDAPPVELPDISTLEKAQAWLGLDMTAVRTSKASFEQTVVPRWLLDAREAGRI